MRLLLKDWRLMIVRHQLRAIKSQWLLNPRLLYIVGLIILAILNQRNIVLTVYKYKKLTNSFSSEPGQSHAETLDSVAGKV